MKQGCRVATTDAIVTEVGQCRHWFEELLHHHPRNTKQLPSAQSRNANLEQRQGRSCWSLTSCRHNPNMPSFTKKNMLPIFFVFTYQGMRWRRSAPAAVFNVCSWISTTRLSRPSSLSVQINLYHVVVDLGDRIPRTWKIAIMLLYLDIQYIKKYLTAFHLID